MRRADVWTHAAYAAAVCVLAMHQVGMRRDMDAMREQQAQGSRRLLSMAATGDSLTHSESAPSTPMTVGSATSTVNIVSPANSAIDLKPGGLTAAALSLAPDGAVSIPASLTVTGQVSAGSLAVNGATLSQPPVVNFAAYKTFDSQVAPHEVIVFDGEVENTGGAYSTSTGAFTAPYDGLYVFTWTVYAVAANPYEASEIPRGSPLNIRIFKNGADTKFASKFGPGAATGYSYDQSVSGSVALTLLANDYVDVRICFGCYTQNVKGKDAFYYTFFSGWLQALT